MLPQYAGAKTRETAMDAYGLHELMEEHDGEGLPSIRELLAKKLKRPPTDEEVAEAQDALSQHMGSVARGVFRLAAERPDAVVIDRDPIPTSIDMDYAAANPVGIVEGLDIDAVLGAVASAEEEQAELDAQARTAEKAERRRRRVNRKNAKKGGRPLKDDPEDLAKAIKEMHERLRNNPHLNMKLTCQRVCRKHELSIGWEALRDHVKGKRRKVK